ncbi:MAG TPA: hypothetical protein VFY82_01535 [Acidimicrobiales bacterium]|nr:hypothetical protein [Acidimicrobiales bacterium]
MSIQHESDRDPAGTVAPPEPGETDRGDTGDVEPAPDAAGNATDEAENVQPEAVRAEAVRPETVEASPGSGLPAYRPPPSPAYAAPSEPVVVPAAPPSAAASAAPEAAPDRRLGWQLLIAGLVLVFVATVVAVLAFRSGGGTDAYAFGTVSAITGDLTVRPGLDADLRELEVGDEVLPEWIVEAADDGAATIELAGGGILRIDSGTRLRFFDLAVDPDTGVRARASEPAVDVRGGRAWLLPGVPEDDTATVRAQIAGGVVELDEHPVALDCTDVCTVEAPTGGVTVTTEDGQELAPTAHELLQVGPGSALDLTIAESASAWARQNLDADEQAGLSVPEVDDGPGIVGSAVLDGTYAVAITVVGPPTGDAIPTALQYPEGETYALDLATDGSGCDAPPCAVPVSSVDGLSGTAQVRGGEVELTFGLPINCFDPTHTSVVLPDIGTTAVSATLDVEAVDFDGERWHVRRLAGTGTIAATMSTTCNQGDVLGTSTSPITIAGS